ncbi:MAG: ribonuclease H-like domain-containing protein [Candidatus Acidiferrales bacterium]
MPGTLDRFSRLAALKPARPAPLRHANLRQPTEDDSLAQLLGASVATNRYGEHLVVRNWHSTPEFTAPFSSALELLSRTRDESLSRRTRAALEDPAKWLFLDTETTGLAGGTGTYAFLVGLAWWDAGGLQVEQFFMRDFGEEHSLLHELAARLAARPVLVTFNGKSFDWPLLESRFTMTRAIATPRLAAHLDLLHPARALWKFRLGSVRLVDLERHVLGAQRLGWQRDDDVPSALIPQFYFDYLRGGSPAPLLGVVRHNQMDLRGLAALFGKINSFLGQDDRMSGAFDSLDLFGLSRFLHRKGESGRAHIACAQALDLGLPAEFSPRARLDLALLSKRRGDHEQAAALWHEIAADPCDGVLACEQLAIYYERRIKDHSRATEFAKLALAKVRLNRTKAREPFFASSSASQESRLLRRLERLERKLALSGNPPNTALISSAKRLSTIAPKRHK